MQAADVLIPGYAESPSYCHVGSLIRLLMVSLLAMTPAAAQDTNPAQPAPQPEVKAATAEMKAATGEIKAVTEAAKAKTEKAPKPAEKPKEEKPKPEPKKEKPPKPKASWQFHPSIRLDTSYDETVYPRYGNTQEPAATFVTTIAPGFQVHRRQGRDYVDLRYQLYARFYEEMRERDSQSHSLSFSWNQRPSDKWGWRLYDRFTYLDDVGGAADDEVTRLISYADNLLQADGDARIAERWKLLVGAGYEVRDYDDPVRADWYTISPSWGLEWKPDGGRWTLVHEYKYLNIEEGDDENTHRVLAGYATNLPWKLSLDARAGLLFFETTDDTDPAGLVSLYRRWKNARVTLRYERSASVSTGTSLITRRDYASLVPVFTVAKDTSLIGSFSYLLQESKASDRIDTTTVRSGLSLQRRLNKWLTGTLGYTYVDQNARGTSGITLHGSIISAGLSARF